ncbi:MAG: hypothetical protein REI45_15485 [Propionicimonas sp.]|nr:hypothetical protein [Propionicimonas sp.]
MSKNSGGDARRSRRVAIPALIAGGASALVLAFSMTPTFAALTAAIQNTVNTAGSGTLVMEETTGSTITCTSTDGGGVSSNSATCATINKYGGNLAMAPGAAGAVTTTIQIRNAGTVAASAFTLTGGACTQSTNGTVNGTATDLCTKYNIVVRSGPTTIYSGTAAGFASQNLNVLTLLGTSSVAAGSTVPFTFTVTLDSSVGNTYQGLKITQPMTWNFQA